MKETTHQRACRRGLTLVELLVVLTILIVTTMIAISATDQFLDQARYDATQRTLQNAQDAIVGPAYQRDPDGSLSITGFVADMGRLPQVVTLPPTGDPLQELYMPPGITSPPLYSAQTALTGASPGFSDTAGNVLKVTLPCGWRGPYLRYTPGSNSSGFLVDGWGNPFQALTPAGTPITAVGTPIDALLSLGADNPQNPVDPTKWLFSPLQNGTPAPTPLTNIFSSLTKINNPTLSLNTSVTVSVQIINSTTMMPDNPSSSAGNVRVILFTPINGTLLPVTTTPSGTVGTNTGVAPVPITISLVGVASPLNVDWSGQTPTVTFTFQNVTVGPRAIQAFQFVAGTTTATKKSPVTYLMVTPGGPAAKTLIMQ